MPGLTQVREAHGKAGSAHAVRVARRLPQPSMSAKKALLPLTGGNSPDARISHNWYGHESQEPILLRPGQAVPLQ